MQEWWHPLGSRSHHKGDCHGNAEVPKGHRDCSDMLSYHKMKDYVLILFLQVIVNYVF